MSSSHTMSGADNTALSRRARNPGSMRQMFEALVCLAVAVILFRGFEVEGYMISTGSMAPTLFGYHKRVVCPSCNYVFAYGIPLDAAESGVRSSVRADGVPSETAGDDPPLDAPVATVEEFAMCPNCGHKRI